MLLFIKKIFELRLRPGLRDLYRGYGSGRPIFWVKKMSDAISPYWSIGVTKGQQFIIGWDLFFRTNGVSLSEVIRKESRMINLLLVFQFFPFVWKWGETLQIFQLQTNYFKDFLLYLDIFPNLKVESKSPFVGLISMFSHNPPHQATNYPTPPHHPTHHPIPPHPTTGSAMRLFWATKQQGIIFKISIS